MTRHAVAFLLAAALLAAPDLFARDRQPPPPGEKKADEKKPDAKPAPPEPVLRPGVNDVELRLRDGSRFRAQLAGVDKLVLQTAYGDLTIPIAEVRRVRRGDRLSAEEEQTAGELIKEFDSDDFGRRQTAQARLEAFGPPIVDFLRKKLTGASAEARNRMQVAVKKILERGGARPQPLDSVVTKVFEARGILQLEALPVKTRLGEFKAKLSDLETVRWLAYGQRKDVAVQAQEGAKDWIDTGVDADAGEPVLIRASGMLNMHGNNIPVNGTQNWGQFGQFMLCALVGRWGTGGDPFAISDGMRPAPQGSDRLYLKVWWPNDAQNRGIQLQNLSGSFKVNIATGSCVEEAEGGREPAPPPPDPDGAELQQPQLDPMQRAVPWIQQQGGFTGLQIIVD